MKLTFFTFFSFFSVQLIAAAGKMCINHFSHHQPKGLPMICTFAVWCYRRSHYHHKIPFSPLYHFTLIPHGPKKDTEGKRNMIIFWLHVAAVVFLADLVVLHMMDYVLQNGVHNNWLQGAIIKKCILCLLISNADADFLSILYIIQCVMAQWLVRI